EVRPCPIRKVLARLLAEHTAPSTDPQVVATQEKLIALALVERAERDQTERARDGRHDRLQGDLGVEWRDRSSTRSTGEHSGGEGPGAGVGVGAPGVGGATSDERRTQLSCDPGEPPPLNKT